MVASERGLDAMLVEKGKWSLTIRHQIESDLGRRQQLSAVLVELYADRAKPRRVRLRA